MSKSSSFPECFDHCKQITITSLKKGGYLPDDAVVTCRYSWSRGGHPNGNIRITGNLAARYVELNYFYGERPICYRVRLESVAKHFGGCEWYFICPVTGRRCRTLYGIGQYFLSRFAYPSAMYSMQTESKQNRGLSNHFKIANDQWNHATKRHSRTHYNGKLTKRFSRLLKREEKSIQSGAIQAFLDRNRPFEF